MQIDWFTFVAQVVNFLILVWLLKRFLYGPVVKAMDEREASIAARIREAEQKQAAAVQEASSYRQMKEELEQQRKDQLDRAREEATVFRRELIQEARSEVEKIQSEWDEALRREQALYWDALRRQVGTQVLATTRCVLRDLAGADVEAQLIRVFTERLQSLGPEERGRLRGAADRAEEVVVRSAFDISAGQRKGITEALQERLHGAVVPRFETDAGMAAGVELKVGGWKLAWSLDSYMEALEDRFTAALQQGAAGAGKLQHDPSTAP